MQIAERDMPLGIRLRHTFDANDHIVQGIAWSPDGVDLLGIAGNGTAWLWNLESGETRWRVKHTHGVPSRLAWSPDGRFWVIGTWQGLLQLCGARDGSGHEVYRGFTGGVVGVDWSTDGDRILAISSESEFGIWEMFSGQQISQVTFRTDNAINRCAAWSSDRAAVAIGSASGRVEYRRMPDWRIAWAIPGDGVGSANCIAFSADGRTLARAAGGEVVNLWMNDEAQELWSTEAPFSDPWEATQEVRPALQTLPGFAGGSTWASFSSDSQFLAIHARHKTLYFWHIDSSRLLARVLCDAGEVIARASLAFHPNLPVLATVALGGRVVQIWDVDSELLMKTVG